MQVAEGYDAEDRQRASEKFREIDRNNDDFATFYQGWEAGKEESIEYYGKEMQDFKKQVEQIKGARKGEVCIQIPYPSKIEIPHPAIVMITRKEGIHDKQ